MRCAAVVPVFDHERAVGAVLDGLRAAGLHSFVVDDGSGERCARELDRLAATRTDVTLVRLPANLGKGGAVMAGLRAAHAAGFSHALQIDADGQHAVTDVPRFLAEAAAHPDAVVCGQPVFDASIPRSRLYGRYLTHVFVWLNTLSFSIPDTMCGFRVYPLAPVVALIDRVRLGTRMDFDIEILVRLHWEGQSLRWLPTRVSYPADGLSHFRLWLDNALISRVHARLFAGMVLRLPRILARRLGTPPREAAGA